MGLERTAALWGFQKALPPDEVVTVSPRMTLVASKFKLLIKMVITSTYHFSSSVWLSGAIGLVNSTPDMVAETVWVAALIRLISCPIGCFSTWSLVEGTMVYLLSGMDPNDEEVVTCASWASAGYESMLLISVRVGWGHQLVVPGSILSKPWIMSCLEKMMCSFTLSLSSRTLLAKGQKSESTGRLSLSAQYCNPQA